MNLKTKSLKKSFCAWSLSAAALAYTWALVSVAGCGGGPSESESKMTSYSSKESVSETAALFTVPQEQMAHVQIVSVAKSTLPRVLRLTGSVAYNAFKTTPVFSAIGGSFQSGPSRAS